jgi:NAD-reducing hydrogenase small subunit
MALLDGGEALLELLAAADLVFSPLVDRAEFPLAVDVCLVEGAASTTADLEALRAARARSRALVALGDCAAWGSVTAMRDAIGGRARALETRGGAAPDPALPELLERVLAVAEVVPVERFLPGCPPGAAAMLAVLDELLSGARPHPRPAGRFG